ncbi:PLD nuclease N-terminal domain-containing protein [Algoriphagus terrigena]|uniref:PLD nuclease N-terminal domain-containing protein n=1 Tax=Algoriphagus terrigena TaxID=344884 RepID=UPI0024803330|nr:PLD nuclease N-terminal domain-containing protein [Algoriphagus terrigena]
MIYALVDVIRSEFREPLMKLTWVVLILFFPFFGALIYLFLGKKNKNQSRKFTPKFK